MENVRCNWSWKLGMCFGSTITWKFSEGDNVDP